MNQASGLATLATHFFLLAFLIGAIVVQGTVAQRGEAAVLCATPKKDGSFNTTVMIREKCAKNEVQLNSSALGLQGPPGPPGPTGPAGPRGTQGPPGPGLVVRDANGALVGVVLGRAINQSKDNIQINTRSVEIVREVAGVLVEFL